MKNPATTASDRRYYPALDGLRAIAVAIVLLAHAGAPYPISGGVGVDIFFVLSGFLITSILASEFAATAKIKIKRFYLRRAFRLMPCLVAVCALYALMSYQQSGEWPLTTLAIVLSYTGNWARAVYGTTLGSLNHTWSLAIEEQFYLLWPLLILGLERISRSNMTKAISLATVALAFAIYRALMTGTYSAERIYYGLDTHIDGLILGAALCYVIRIFQSRDHIDPIYSKCLGYLATPFAVIGLAVIMGYLGWWNKYMALVGFALVACASATIIADLVVGNHSLIKRFLSLKFLVQIGKISYGIYLWHFPVFHLCNKVFHLPEPYQGTIKIAASVLVAVISYIALEKPFLDLKERLTSSKVQSVHRSPSLQEGV